MAWTLLKKGTTATYHGKRVKVREVVGDKAYILIFETQEEGWVDFDKLENFHPKPRVIQ
jgi:hypothetical protein